MTSQFYAPPVLSASVQAACANLRFKGTVEWRRQNLPCSSSLLAAAEYAPPGIPRMLIGAAAGAALQIHNPIRMPRSKKEHATRSGMLQNSCATLCRKFGIPRKNLLT
jgi:hypothetical protein